MLTTALLAARFFHGNLCSASRYMQEHQGCRMIDKSGFVRRLHGLKGQLLSLFLALGQTLKQLNTSCRYLIDSFPVAVCDNIRIRRCRLLEGKDYRGYSASKRRYFYGFRVQVITTEEGLPVQFYVHAGSFADVTPCPWTCPRAANSTPTPATPTMNWRTCSRQLEGVRLLACRKRNAKRAHQPYQAYLKQHYRKRIETTFSQITGFFPKKLHAVTAEGFILKLILLIFAFTLSQVA